MKPERRSARRLRAEGPFPRLPQIVLARSEIMVLGSLVLSDQQ